ncbi:uncharacterized protein TM35_000023810 [Trypanosoma theileri]|uniref:Surface protein TolT n=1 Tax=Trypanosoma theileri TaxID=67003 RepID=A0A1X0P891_9TRYP|nr:uncharacterized protein TM35_000023810 [Trypanosoma theileri]ORC93055.1 hypothetical protein TM35_000023810 [Trypanosoma theileri]
MSILSCRVLCLLAIVLCCVGVAPAASHGMLSPVELAKKKVEETLRLKGECEEATNAVTEAALAAQRFAHNTEIHLVTIAADQKEVEKRKSEGLQFIDNTTKAAEKATEVRDKTTASVKETRDNSIFLREKAEEAEQAADNAESATRDATSAIETAKTHINGVKKVLKELDAAVAAAKEKEKQVESQTQEQTNKTSLDEQQGHTEGNKAEQTQKEKQRQHYRSTVTINIHGDNLDALLNGAANNSGMALNDGSSSPALLRVPLLLLLLSVLGCMAVC